MMQSMNGYNTLDSIDTSEWLQSNNLSHLVQQFVPQNVTISSLIKMNADQLQLNISSDLLT